MKNEFKFSILMASYNNGSFIKESIESVLAQTYKNWELVIVDDASVDNSVDTIKGFLDDDRIKLIQHSNNLGCGQTKKDCADNSDGHILGELDPDDVLDKYAIEVIVDTYARNSDIGFVYSTHYECDENLKVKRIPEWVGDSSEINLKKLKVSAFRTFKKDFYKMTEGYDFQKKGAVDADLVYKMEEVTKFKFINKPLYYYRKSGHGISQGKNLSKSRICDIEAKYAAYKRRLGSEILNLTKEGISNELLLGFVLCIKNKDFNKSFIFLSESIKIYPFNVGGYLILFWRLIKFPFYRLIRRFYPNIERIYD